jgi:nucleoside-diphosphate-sugar epimerase
MKRRSFLQRTGIVMAGGAGVLAGPGPAQQAAPHRGSGDCPAADLAKRILITAAQTEAAQAIAGALGGKYRLRLMTQEDIRTEHEIVRSSLDPGEPLDSAVRGVDAIVRVPEPDLDADEGRRIDMRTRCTYHLLQAAARAGVQGVVYLSSLRVMTAYPEHFDVDEDWRPLPTATSGGLPDYLGEFTCREFARDKSLKVVVLRLGDAMPSESLAGKPPGPLWVDPRDAAQAAFLAVTAVLAPAGSGAAYWSVYHIQSESSGARFSVRRAKKSLGYRPQYSV